MKNSNNVNDSISFVMNSRIFWQSIKYKKFKKIKCNISS